MKYGLYFLAGMAAAGASPAKTKYDLLADLFIFGCVAVVFLVVSVICWWTSRR